MTGSLVAKAIKADMYENWTDVSGFLVTDPVSYTHLDVYKRQDRKLPLQRARKTATLRI